MDFCDKMKNKQSEFTKWIKRHPVWTGVIGLFILLMVLGSFSSVEESSTTADQDTKTDINEDAQVIPTEPEPETIDPEIIEPEREFFIVARVIDGDTIEIDTGESVRLICIDTLERGQNGYQEAKDYLEGLVLGKEVKLVRDISETDKYDRLLRYVYLDGDFVNEMIVREGHGSAYPYSPDTSLCPQILEAEAEAKEKEKGIWAVEEVVEEEAPPEEDTGDSGYDCSSNVYNCGDFSTHAEAQEVFEFCGGVGNDIHALDRDDDGLACETLP